MAKKTSRKNASLAQQFEALKREYQGKLHADLDNYANRYTIYLPVYSKVGQAFAKNQISPLLDLLIHCWGGFSQSEDHNGPPWKGVWLSSQKEIVIDYHILVLVYAKYGDESDLLFRKIKTILEQDESAAQDVVVIEKLTVQLLPRADD